jgi:AcrR family transcriptional regulator
MAGDVVPLDRSDDRDFGRQHDEPPLPLEGHDTRARILRAGLAMFAERGYHATSIRDIAAGAGIQSASLYSHFPSKEAILAELVLIGHEVHHRALVQALAAAGQDPRDQLHRLVSAHVAMHCRYATLATVTTREQQHLSPEAARPSLALLGASQMLAETVLARGEELGVFDVADPEIIRVAIGSLGFSVTPWYPKRADHFTPEEVGEAYAELALRMVGAAATPEA